MCRQRRVYLYQAREGQSMPAQQKESLKKKKGRAEKSTPAKRPHASRKGSPKDSLTSAKLTNRGRQWLSLGVWKHSRRTARNVCITTSTEVASRQIASPVASTHIAAAHFLKWQTDMLHSERALSICALLIRARHMRGFRPEQIRAVL
eukprot:scaffold84707_cov18-Tisochrysis_lutea.AAC.1